MPIYAYAPAGGSCDRCGGAFQCWQRMVEPHHDRCPTCGAACVRVPCAVALGGGGGPSAAAIERAGFTQYKRAGAGVYERSAGTRGPTHLFGGER